MTISFFEHLAIECSSIACDDGDEKVKYLQGAHLDKHLVTLATVLLSQKPLIFTMNLKYHTMKNFIPSQHII